MNFLSWRIAYAQRGWWDSDSWGPDLSNRRRIPSSAQQMCTFKGLGRRNAAVKSSENDKSRVFYPIKEDLRVAPFAGGFSRKSLVDTEIR